MTKTQQILLNVLREEIKPSFGVTEPAAVALASASTYAQVGGRIRSIKVILNQGLFKNAAFCEVPRSGSRGISVAAVLGALGGNPDKGLNVLRDVKKEDIQKAKTLLKKNVVNIKIEKRADLFLAVELITDRGSARAVIRDTHDNIVLIQKDKQTVYKGKRKRTQSTVSPIDDYRIIDLLNFTKDIPLRDISFISDAMSMNRDLMEEGLKGNWGLRAGEKLYHLMNKGDIADDLMNSVAAAVACAIDARVGGAPKPAMSVVGSGSHGCVACLPIMTVAEKKGIEGEIVLRACALSFLITIYLKKYTGRLSAFCGCAITAAIGAAVGIVFLLGGNLKQMVSCINNMVGDVTGLLCDGGNFSCSLKCATGVSSAVRSALLALERISVPDNCGIVGSDVEDTIRNLGLVSFPGMKKTDEVVVDIISKRVST